MYQMRKQAWRFIGTMSLLLVGLLLLAGSQPAQARSLANGEDNQTQSFFARVQVIHLAPFAEGDAAVNVAINGAHVLNHFEYGDATNYLHVFRGHKTIEIFPAGSHEPAIKKDVELKGGKFYTLIAIGDGQNRPLDLLVLQDDLSHPPAGQGKIRLGHLAPFADTLAGTTADVRLQDGTVILDDVQFGDVAGYLPLDAGEYDLKITTPDGAATLIDPLPVELGEGEILNAFAAGDGSSQPLGVFGSLAGHPGDFLPLSARLYIAHLAPFAMGEASAVTVKLNGQKVLEGFEYGASTGYLTIPAGKNDVEIIVEANHATIFDAEIDFAQATDYTALAIGDTSNQPFAVELLVDDNSAPPAGQAKLRLGHLAPFADTLAGTTADVRLQDGTVILDDVQFGAVAGYLVLDAGSYDLKITTPDGATTLIDPQPVTLNDGDIVSAFATGEGNNADLGVFAIINGMQGVFLPLEQPAGMARLYLAHLAPFAPGNGSSVTIKLGDMMTLENIVYGDYTGYLDLPAGSYDVEIIPTGAADPAIAGTVTLEADKDYTALAIGDGGNQPLALKALVDDNSAPPAGQAKLRLGHLAPFADTLVGTTADVRLQDGSVILDDVQFGAVGGYLTLDAGSYDLKITTPDGATTLIDPQPVTLNDGDIVSAFATGEGNNADLGVFAIINGMQGVFLPLEQPAEPTARLYVAHLAPFASGSGSEVVVKLNGAETLAGFAYGDSTGYLELPAGSYDIEIFPAGAADPAIAGTVTLEADTDYTALAIGDGGNQPLALKALVDDNSAPPAGQAKLRLGHLAPFAATLAGTTADVRLQDGTVILDDVQFGAAGGYLTLDAGSYDLKITTPDGKTTLIDPLPVTLNDGDIVSAFAAGEGNNQDLGVFAIVNGAEGLFLPLDTRPKATIKLIHLAPFAADREATAVAITLDDEVIADNLRFGQTTPFLEVVAGDVEIEVFPQGAADPVLSESGTLKEDRTYLGIVIGDGQRRPLKLLLVEVRRPPFGFARLTFGHMAPFAGEVADVRLQDGTILLNDVRFGSMVDANALTLPAGRYDLLVTSADGTETYFDPIPMNLAAGDVVNAFTMSDPTSQELGVFAAINDGNTFLSDRYRALLPVFMTVP